MELNQTLEDKIHIHARACNILYLLPMAGSQTCKKSETNISQIELTEKIGPVKIFLMMFLLKCC